MSETFQVGEIVLFKNLSGPFGRLNGEECEIMELERMRLLKDIFGNPGYAKTYVVLYCGFPVAMRGSKLKKRPGSPQPVAVPRELEAA